jgi:anti-sigma regulatory factor (Ser/Thr protein kinase)
VVRHERLALLPALESVREGRDFVRRLVEEWQLGELGDAAELLVSEALTNAVDHAATAVRLDVFAGDGLLVWVSDSDRAFVPTSPAADDPEVSQSEAPPHERGRGLAVIAAVADRWGIDQHPDGKTVWFAFDVPQRPGSG